MAYLLIVLVLAIILSPLMSLRQSPRQKQITRLRQSASRNGLMVKLTRPLSAREGEGALDSVCYLLPWAPDSTSSPLRRAEQWQLVRNSGRGDSSPWKGWQWLTLPAAEELQAAIGDLLEGLVDDVSGVAASGKGLAIYWKERGTDADVEQICQRLKKLQSAIRR